MGRLLRAPFVSRMPFVSMVMAATVGLTSIAVSPIANALVDPGPVEWVDLDVNDKNLVNVAFSPNGHFGVVNLGGFVYEHVDLRSATYTGFSKELLGAVLPTDDGTTIFSLTADTVTVHDVATATANDLDLPLSAGWEPFAIDAASADGGFLVITASNGALGAVRSFVVDVATSELVTPEDAGITSDGSAAEAIAMSADADDIFYKTSTPQQAVVWNRSTGERTTRTPSDLSTASTAGWAVTTDLEWAVFPGRMTAGSNEPEVLLRKRKGASAPDTVPVDYTTLERWAILPDGTVFFVAGTDLDIGLFVWSEVGTEPTEIAVNAAGESPDLPIENGFHVASDSSRLFFTSLASNLTDDTVDGRQLYSIDLDAPAAPEPSFRLPTDDGAERLVNTRDTRPVAALGTLCVPAVGAEPGDFVGINITPVDATTAGFGTMHSSDVAAGATSNVNFGPGTVDPNVAFVQVGTDGNICFTNSRHGPVNVIIDQLITAPGATFRPPNATGSSRLIDTRKTRPVPALGDVCVIAAGARVGEFVGVNVTPVDATAAGFGVVHSSDTAAGATSNVNFGPGTVDPNVAFVQVGTDGNICFTNSRHGPVNVIIDEFVIAAADTFALPREDGAARLVNTREATPVAALATLCVAAVGAEAGDYVVVNVTPVDATAAGFGVVHSSDTAAGATSNVNFGPGTVDPNVAFVQVGTDGNICFTNSRHGPVNVIIDELVVAAV